MKSVLSNACTIKLENFEGPFDLLVYLIEKNEVDIYDIAINDITDQYMEYLFAMQDLNLEIASEFLVVAATLLHIKSRLLLPNHKKDEAEEEVDPREELIMRLVEYKRYKNFAKVLKKRQEYWSKAYYKLPELIQHANQESFLNISSVDLRISYINIMDDFYKKKNDDSKKMRRILEHEKVSLRSKAAEIIKYLKKSVRVCFSVIFDIRKRSRLEVATGFLAMLEIVKLKKAVLEQKREFGEIYIIRKDKKESLKKR